MLIHFQESQANEEANYQSQHNKQNLDQLNQSNNVLDEYSTLPGIYFKQSQIFYVFLFKII